MCKRANFQSIVRPLYFSFKINQTKTRCHICDSREASFAYLYSQIVYLYISSVCRHIVPNPCAHPQLCVSTTCSTMSAETQLNVCTRSTELVHTISKVSACTFCTFVYICKKTRVTHTFHTAKQESTTNVIFITEPCQTNSCTDKANSFSPCTHINAHEIAQINLYTLKKTQNEWWCQTLVPIPSTRLSNFT